MSDLSYIKQQRELELQKAKAEAFDRLGNKSFKHDYNLAGEHVLIIMTSTKDIEYTGRSLIDCAQQAMESEK